MEIEEEGEERLIKRWTRNDFVISRRWFDSKEARHSQAHARIVNRPTIEGVIKWRLTNYREPQPTRSFTATKINGNAKVRLIRNVRAHRARGLLGAQSRAPDERFDICVSRILILFWNRLFWKLIWLISCCWTLRNFQRRWTGLRFWENWMIGKELLFLFCRIISQEFL